MAKSEEEEAEQSQVSNHLLTILQIVALIQTLIDDLLVHETATANDVLLYILVERRGVASDIVDLVLQDGGGVVRWAKEILVPTRFQGIIIEVAAVPHAQVG